MHSWQGRGVDFEDDDDGNNNGRRRGLIMTRTTTKTLTAMTHGQLQPLCLTQQPTGGRMHSWHGGGDDFDDKDDGNNDGRRGGLILLRTTTKTLTAMTPWTTMTSFFDTTTNMWSDAFLAGTWG